MKNPRSYSPLALAIFLSACSTMPVTQQPAKAAAAPVVDLTPARQSCSALQNQLLPQLPFQIRALMHWKATSATDPLQPTGQQWPACEIRVNTNGATILKLGLSPDFMNAALERLDWQTGTPQTNAYAADGPNSHVQAYTQGQSLAVVGYEFGPRADQCPKNQPIAACTVPQKQWNYQMKLLVLMKK